MKGKKRKPSQLKFLFLLSIGVMCMIAFFSMLINSPKEVTPEAIYDSNEVHVMSGEEIENVEQQYEEERKEKRSLKGQLGNETYETIIATAEQAMTLLVQKEQQGWETIATPTLVEHITKNQNLFPKGEAKVIEVFPKQDMKQENKVIVSATMKEDGKLKGYDLVFQAIKENYLIDDIVLTWEN